MRRRLIFACFLRLRADGATIYVGIAEDAALGQHNCSHWSWHRTLFKLCASWVSPAVATLYATHPYALKSTDTGEKIILAVRLTVEAILQDSIDHLPETLQGCIGLIHMGEGGGKKAEKNVDFPLM